MENAVAQNSPPHSQRGAVIKRCLIIAAGIFVVYFGVAQLTRLLFYTVPGAPAISFVPAGVALAALIIYGYQFWPALALASLANGYIISAPLPILFVGVAGNVLQALAGVYVLRKFGFDLKLARSRDVQALIIVALFTTLINPIFRSLAYWINGTPLLQTSWNFLWLASVMSVIIFTPLLVRWISFPQWQRIRTNFLETAVVFSFLIAVNFLIFWTPYTTIGGTQATPTASGSGGFSLVLVQLLLFLWVALRMGMARMTLALFLTTIIGLTGLYFGMIPPPPDRLAQKIIGVELYMIIFAVLYYVIAAISEERDLALARLRDNVQELEQALRKISNEDRMKNEFIAALAHELRNPMAPIMYHLQAMELEGVSDSKFNKAAAGIGRQVKNITHLLEDLLDLSRITQGRVRLNKEKTDVRAAIQRAAHDVQPHLNVQAHVLHTDLPEKSVWVYADPMRLEQIFINLLHNASKFSERGGTILVSCREEGDSCIVTVRDSGKGIPKEELRRIFDIFASQPSQTHISRLYAGLGIGLHLVKLFVELHDGSVDAASEGAGKGSMFTVRIPRHLESITIPPAVVSAMPVVPDVPARKPVYPDTAALGTEIKKVLVVDDSEDIVKALSLLLTKRGFEVHTVQSGSNALTFAREHAFDAALIDIGLPDMNGYEVARAMRTLIGQSAKLIALTGYGQMEDKMKAREAGFDHHLTKPVPLQEIEKLLRQSG